MDHPDSVLFLHAADTMKPPYEANFYFQCTTSGLRSLHRHDFFEFFLITKGTAIHNINGVIEYLPCNTLIFVRPEDVHCLEADKNNPYEYINFTVSARSFHSLCVYLGSLIHVEPLLEAKTAPYTVLTVLERKGLEAEFRTLNALPDSKLKLKHFKLRTLFLTLLSSFFIHDVNDHGSSNTPEWLYRLCRELEHKENFVQGVDALYSLTAKSREHVCRSFRKYLNCTPTEFINGLRLQYAANLLTHTDWDILTIVLETGFESISYFYSLFEKRYKMTPKVYREQYVNQ